MALKLHDYQEEAVEHLRRHPRACLFLDMGLGKTAATLTALTPDHLPALVVAPKRVAETVWHVEVAKWRPDLRVSVAKGKPADRSRSLASDSDVIVLGRDNLADLKSLRRKPFQTLILDELSGFKSRATARWRAGRALSKRPSTRHVWGLTGTPSPNGLMDLWAQMYLIDQGGRLGTTLGEYRSRYFSAGARLPSGVVTRWDLRPGADKEIHRLLSDVCLSMGTEGRLTLPPVTYNTVTVRLPPDALRAYKEMKKTLVADLDLLGAGTVSAANSAVLSNRLSQISAGFLYPDRDGDSPDAPAAWLHTEKVRAVQEIVDGTGSPVLVFYRYIEEREAILAAIPQAESINSADAIERWNRGTVPVLVAHPASAGHGLNLQHGGHTVVWTSATWSLEEWQQANKRLVRQGQRHPVVIHIIAAHRTIDSAIMQRLESKKTVQQALLDHLESPL